MVLALVLAASGLLAALILGGWGWLVVRRHEAPWVREPRVPKLATAKEASDA